MKKQGLIRNTMIIAALALSLTACGSKNESGTTASDSGSKTATTTAQADTTAKNTEQASEAVTESGQTSENWFFKKGDVTIELNAPSEPIIQALGTAQNTYEAPSCAFDGMDVIYVYPGYEVLTYANDEKSVISGVVLRDDTVATPEGAYIGMSQTDVENLYGQKAAGVSSLQIDKGNCTLLFIFTDGNVSSIQYNMKQQ